MISATFGASGFSDATFDEKSLPPASSSVGGGAFGSGAKRTPILQPPGSAASAPPSQLVTMPPVSPPNDLMVKGLPLSFSSAASGMPSFNPLGAVHSDRP